MSKHPIFIALLAIIVVLYNNSFAANSSSNKKNTPSITYPIHFSDFATTVNRTIIPNPSIMPPDLPGVSPLQLSQFKQTAIYGNWYYNNSGLPIIRRNDFASWSKGITTHSRKLLRFVSITDIHIRDPESPAQNLFMGFCGNNASCIKMFQTDMGTTKATPSIGPFPPTMLYTTQVLDAVIQTINYMHTSIEPFDFLISLGDAINNTQSNEFSWYMAVMDGKTLSPHSGAQAGQDAFTPAGIYSGSTDGKIPAIPWYQVIGDHETFWAGTLPVNNKLDFAFIGSNILTVGNPYSDPDFINGNTYYLGSSNGALPNNDMNITCVGPVSNPDKYIPGCISSVLADSSRKTLSIVGSASLNNIINQLLNTTSTPKGHGFAKASDPGYYSFLIKHSNNNNNPTLKIIVLNDTLPPDKNVKTPTSDGYMDSTQFNWLQQQLQDGQTNHQLMIIAAHVPINVGIADNDGAYAWTTQFGCVGSATVLAELHKYPNLIAWISGHRHINAITPQPSPDPIHHPELAFWEIETAALRDFPQEFRTFDIYLNPDNTISIVTIDVDPVVTIGSGYPVEKSRAYAVAGEQIFQTSKAFSGVNYYYNAELIKLLTNQNSSNFNNNKESSRSIWAPIVGGGLVGVATLIGVVEGLTH